MPRRAIQWRLFLTCWLVYTVHFATDFVREHYLVVSMVEDHSFRLDKYYGLHVDIFQNPPDAPHGGAHHGANPGISMLAAVPYFLLRPAVDLIVRRELEARAQHPDTAIVYNDSRPRRVEFYHEIRSRGLDLRFGLINLITEATCMAPLVAWSAVLLFQLLAGLRLSEKSSLALSLLYAFGTPTFFRAGFLNQNEAIAVFSLAAFVLLWNPEERSQLSLRARFLMAGGLGGLSLLNDYSGGLALGLLGLYALVRRHDSVSWGRALRDSLWYGLGAVGPILLLWYYQWASFGNPFFPPQHWMAPVKWIDVGYKGVGGFTPALFQMLLADPRFGLFVTAPLFLLGLAAPWICRRRSSFVPLREVLFCLGFSLAFVLFFSCVQYTRLQYVTGIRYLAPAFPFLFLATAVTLVRLPRALIWAVTIVSLALSWSLAMVRSQGSVVENLERVLFGGFQLPWLTVLGKTASQYAPWLGSVSPLPVFVLLGTVIYGLWKIRRPWDRPDAGEAAA